MAVFGRRQPHAPVILHGLSVPGKPLSTLVVPRGGFPAQTTPVIARRLHGSTTIIKGGGGKIPPGQIALPFGQGESHWGVLARNRPAGKIQIIKGGGNPSTAKLQLRDKISRDAANLACRPLFQPVIKTLIRYALPAIPPIGKVIEPNGQVPALSSALFRQRPNGNISIKRAGGLPSKSRITTKLGAIEAAIRFRRPLFRVTTLSLNTYVPLPPVSAVISMAAQFVYVRDTYDKLQYVRSQSPQFSYVHSQDLEFAN
jgi:hypothetical protein